MKCLLTKEERVWLWTHLKSYEEPTHLLNPDAYEKMRVQIMKKLESVPNE